VQYYTGITSLIFCSKQPCFPKLQIMGAVDKIFGTDAPINCPRTSATNITIGHVVLNFICLQLTAHNCVCFISQVYKKIARFNRSNGLNVHFEMS
jgi:hypothetical protein